MKGSVSAMRKGIQGGPQFKQINLNFLSCPFRPSVRPNIGSHDCHIKKRVYFNNIEEKNHSVMDKHPFCAESKRVSDHK